MRGRLKAEETWRPCRRWGGRDTASKGIASHAWRLEDCHDHCTGPARCIVHMSSGRGVLGCTHVPAGGWIHRASHIIFYMYILLGE